MKVRGRTDDWLYTSLLQRGGLTVYKGERRMGGGFGLKFLQPVTRFLARKGMSIAKNMLKRAGPKILKTAIATGADVMSVQNVKTAVKKGLKRGVGNIASSSRDALLDEVNIARMIQTKMNAENSKKRRMQGKGLMRLGRKSKIYFP